MDELVREFGRESQFLMLDKGWIIKNDQEISVLLVLGFPVVNYGGPYL